MTKQLDDARKDMARELAEMDFALKTLLTPVHYQTVSRRLGRLLKASSAYGEAVVAAKRKQRSERLVPRFLTEDMRKAMESAKNPVEAWQAAMEAAGVET